MASKENKLKDGTKKTETKPSGKKNSFSRFFQSVVLFFEDKRLHAIVGSFLILFSIFLLVSFVSYFYNWETDFSAITRLAAMGLLPIKVDCGAQNWFTVLSTVALASPRFSFHFSSC